MLRIMSEDEEEKYLKELEEKYISKYSYSSLEVIELSITTIGYMLSTVEIDSNKDHHREISTIKNRFKSSLRQLKRLLEEETIYKPDALFNSYFKVEELTRMVNELVVIRDQYEHILENESSNEVFLLTDKLEEMNNSVELFIKEFREKLNLL